MRTTVRVLYYPVIVGDPEEITRTYLTNIQVICLDEGLEHYDWFLEGVSEAPSDQLAIWTSSEIEFNALAPGDSIADGCIIESIDRQNPMAFEIDVDFSSQVGYFMSERRVY